MRHRADGSWQRPGFPDLNPYFERPPQPVLEQPAVKTPMTWLEKLEAARKVLKEFPAEDRKDAEPDDETQRLFGALIEMTEAVEEVGRFAKVVPVEKQKKTRRRESRDSGI